MLIRTVLLIAIVALAGCKSENTSQKEGTTATAVSGEKKAHADEGVKPGSHEDWCGEHAVPESQCTRCNGSLVAAFKATGDWCDEHGLPESQCLKCNPSLKIVRPPKAN